MLEAGILIDKPKREKPKTVCTPENIAAVAESVCEAPSTSIQCRSQQLNISETSLRRILHEDLGTTSYKGLYAKFVSMTSSKCSIVENDSELILMALHTHFLPQQQYSRMYALFLAFWPL